MQLFRTVSILTVTFATVLAFSLAQGGEVRISAAASMTTVLKELTAEFVVQHPEVTIVENFGSSGGLAKQIQQGAPVELYISANIKWMHLLVNDKLIQPENTTTFAYNSLVFVGHHENPITSLFDLPTLQRIGIGAPKSVPAGQYAAQALQASGLYERLLKDGKLVMAKDVRQALIYADRGETDGSFVYKTDAMLATSAKILFEVPQNLYDPVAYPIGLTKAGTANGNAKALYDYILSGEAKTIIAKHGFAITSP